MYPEHRKHFDNVVIKGTSGSFKFQFEHSRSEGGMPTLAHPPIHQAWPSNAWRRYGEYYLKLTPTVTGLLRNDTADSFVSRRLGLCLFSAGLEVQTRYPPGLLVIRHSHGGGLGPKAIHHPEAGGQTFCPPQSPASPMKSTVS